jgi:hypothetical protein
MSVRFTTLHYKDSVILTGVHFAVYRQRDLEYFVGEKKKKKKLFFSPPPLVCLGGESLFLPTANHIGLIPLF